MKITCSICKGEGGWLDPIMDDGSGPYDECGACQGSGEVGLRKSWSLWFWDHVPEWYLEFIVRYYDFMDKIKGIEYNEYGERIEN